MMRTQSQAPIVAALLPAIAWFGTTLGVLVHSAPAQAANGECRWENGPGAPQYAYCKVEDCIGNGGLAQCSAAVPAPPDGWSDSELGPDKWLYGICGEWGPSIGLENRWCLAAGGTLVSTPTGAACEGLPPTALRGNPTVANQEGLMLQLSQAYANVSTPDCPVTLQSDTGWGATLAPISCAAGSTTFDKQLPVSMLRRIQWKSGGACNDVLHTFTATASRAAKCEGTGYTSRVTPHGVECYRPTECCEARVGNPVSTISGAKFTKEVDYDPGSAGGLTFARYYKSSGYFRFPQLSVLPGPLDTMLVTDFWHHSYDRRLYVVSGNTEVMAIQQRADGTLRTFDTSGREMSNTDGAAARLTPSAGGYDLKLANSDIEHYDSSGRLTSIVTRSGMTTTLSYSNGLLSTVTDAFGHAITLSYANGLLQSVTLPDNGTIQYSYDAYKRLVRVTYPDSTTREYEYGDIRNWWLLTGIRDETTQTFATYTYDATGRVVSEAHSGGVDQYEFTYGPSSTSVTDPRGAATQYSYAATAGTLRKSSHSQPCADCGTLSSRTFDAQGNVASTTDFNGNAVVYGYDLTRNLEISRTEADGTPRARTVTTQWHSTYRLPTQIDEPGRQTTFTHDSAGNVLTRTVTDTATSQSRTWTYTYNSKGQVLTVDGPRTDAADITTYTYFDCTSGAECGQVSTVTNAAGHTTTYLTYNAHGQPLTMADANNVSITLIYDARQRLTSREVGGELTSLSYHPSGLLKRVTLPDGSYLEYTYDGAHRLTRIEDSEGNRISYTLNGAGERTIESVYDPTQTLARVRGRIYDTLGRVLSELDANNDSVSYLYDSNGNVDALIDQESRPTTYAYDELNRQKSMTDSMGGSVEYTYSSRDELEAVADPRSLTTSYQYNGFGDLTRLTSPDTGIIQYTRNAAGNIQQSTDARNKTATYSYDVLDRVTEVSYPDQTITFTYDQGSHGKGHLTQITDASGTTHWTYTAQGRVATRQQVAASTTFNVGYGYNAAGQLNQLTTPSGQTIGYTYSNGRVASITVNGSPLLSSVLYSPFGPTSGWTWANGTFAIREYDLNGRPTTIDSAGLATYQFYPDGTIRSWTDDNSAPLTGPSGLTEFEVDPNSNQLTSSTGLDVHTYSHDAAGNIIDDGTRTFTYNAAGRMVSVTNGGVTASYAVNGLGQRVRKTIGGVARHFVYDEVGHLLGEYDNAGALIQETVWFEDIPVAALKPNGGGGVNVFYIHTDHLNTPRRISRPSDNVVVWRWDSDPFGTTAAKEDPDGDSNLFSYNLRFPGQYFDAETGLHYNYFRVYDPQTGRYSQSDPIGLQGGLNTYAYAGANPLSHFDPLGLSDTTDTPWWQRPGIPGLPPVERPPGGWSEEEGLKDWLKDVADGANSIIQRICTSDDDCQKLYAAITKQMNLVKRRYWEYIEDKMVLPENGQKMSRKSHREAFWAAQKGLRNKLQDADTKGCVAYDPTAWDWATRELVEIPNPARPPGPPSPLL